MAGTTYQFHNGHVHILDHIHHFTAPHFTILPSLKQGFGQLEQEATLVPYLEK